MNYAGLNKMYESFVANQSKYKRQERLYSRLLGMVNLLAIIIKGQYLKNQSTEVAHSWMWHVNRQEAEAILRSEPTRKPGYFCVRPKSDEGPDFIQYWASTTGLGNLSSKSRLSERFFIPEF